MNSSNKQKGFTIIEVVLVLAIAGTIFLMVFIALPALQRNTRDSQRKQDLSRMQTAVSNYTGNNRGNLPSSTQWGTFVSQYLTVGSDTFVDPSGVPSTGTGGGNGVTTYVLIANPNPADVNGLAGSFATLQNVIYYGVGFGCSPTNGAVLTAGGTRKVALQMALEGGGIYCVNN